MGLIVQTLNLILLTLPSLPPPPPLKLIFYPEIFFSSSSTNSHGKTLSQNGTKAVKFGKCEEEKKISGQKISFKGDGGGRDGNGVKVFASHFHCWCHNPVATFSLCLFAHAYNVAFQSVQKFSSLDVTVVFLMQMDKLVCSNIDSKQEVIREKQQLGGSQRSLAIVRNMQY